MQQFSVLGVDLVSSDIEFFFGVADRNIGQHENFMYKSEAMSSQCGSFSSIITSSYESFFAGRSDVFFV